MGLRLHGIRADSLVLRHPNHPCTSVVYSSRGGVGPDGDESLICRVSAVSSRSAQDWTSPPPGFFRLGLGVGMRSTLVSQTNPRSGWVYEESVSRRRTGTFQKIGESGSQKRNSEFDLLGTHYGVGTLRVHVTPWG